MLPTRSAVAPVARQGLPIACYAELRDFAQVEGDGVVTHQIACSAMDRLDVDSAGLDAMDRKYC